MPPNPRPPSKKTHGLPPQSANEPTRMSCGGPRRLDKTTRPESHLAELVLENLPWREFGASRACARMGRMSDFPRFFSLGCLL